MDKLTRLEAITSLRSIIRQNRCAPKDWLKKIADAFSETPEGCKLVAHNTGDGWALTVQDQNGDTVAMLEWPESWPEIMNADQIREAGFRID